MRQPFVWAVLMLVCVGHTFPLRNAWAASQEHSWQTVETLSNEELQAVDLATDTPRHAEFPYLPAEAYPFSAPYTAEEMGYRAMEFTQRPRWSCAYALPPIC